MKITDESLSPPPQAVSGISPRVLHGFAKIAETVVSDINFFRSEPVSAHELGLPYDVLTDKQRFLAGDGDVVGDGDLAGGADEIAANRRCYMIQCSDGVLALNLSRPSDWELLPALLSGAADEIAAAPNFLPPPPGFEEAEGGVSQETEGDISRVVEDVRRICIRQKASELLKQAIDLGLAAALVGEHLLMEPVSAPCRITDTGALRSDPADNFRVVDMSVLWAGPLAGKLLAETGAEVLKLETRPDMQAPKPDPVVAKNATTQSMMKAPDFYNYLNGGKLHASAQFDAAVLQEFFKDADVVIDSSRPRALHNIGITPLEISRRFGLIWVSITGHGRSSNRVAFGDDAAVAGGLYQPPDYPPNQLPDFVGDAIADPITGVFAAHAALRCLREQRAALIDVGMSQAVRFLTQDS